MAYEQLDRALGKVKLALMTDKRTPLYGAIVCSLGSGWDPDVPTAATNGKTILWSPDFFMSLTDAQRLAVQVHEIEHVVRLHIVREGGRHHARWAKACDYEINLDLKDAGYELPGSPLCDEQFRGMLAEDIYELLPECPGEDDDGHFQPLREIENANPAELTQLVVNAISAAGGRGGCGHSAITQIMERLFNPPVPLLDALQEFCTELGELEPTWNRRNRRYEDIFIPGSAAVPENLEHIACYFDTSGSMSDDQAAAYLGVAKSLHATFCPETMRIVQFDDEIRSDELLLHGTEFSITQLHGRGGTSLECVREHILTNQISLAIVFSDMECDDMEWIGCNLFWVILDSPGRDVPFGRKFHITTA